MSNVELTEPPSGPGHPPPQTGGSPLDLSWLQPPGMVGLSFKNFLLKIVTLGIYGFWGKTEVRQRIWTAARLNGEPLQYTGTGKELMLGFLVVFGVVVIPAMLVSSLATLYFDAKSTIGQTTQLLLTALFFFLTGIAVYRAQRYRLSRTRWRGIRGGMEGSSTEFAWTYFWTGALIPLTLGWISPWRSTKLQSLLTGAMRFGDRPFRFTASSGPLYGRFAILWFGALTIIGSLVLSWYMAGSALGIDFRNIQPGSISASLIAALIVLAYGGIFLAVILYLLLSGWYRARMMNHFAAHTHFEGATFRGRATAWSLIWLGISNFLLVIFSLGLLVPVAQARSARYMVQRLALDGSAALDEIAQRSEDELKRGEGLAQAFDIDAF